MIPICESSLLETSVNGSYASALNRIKEKIEKELSKKLDNYTERFEVIIYEKSVDIIDKLTGYPIYQIYPELTGNKAKTTKSNYIRVYDPDDIDWDNDIVYKSVSSDTEINTYSSKNVRIKQVSTVSNSFKNMFSQILGVKIK